MTSHRFKQNEISQEQMIGTHFFKRSYFTVRSSFVWDNKNFNDSATLKCLI
jgi:hypothetical protein